MSNKILKYNKYSFLKNNFKLNESTELSDMQTGLGGIFGAGFGYANDPQLTNYSDGSSPYMDSYQRMSSLINDLSNAMKNIHTQLYNSTNLRNANLFLEDIDNYNKLKILRIYQNENLKLDVFISFEYNEEEFFGVYKNFNDSLKKPKLQTELLTDPRMSYIDNEYYLKLNNYFFKILNNWFKPIEGFYKILSDDFVVDNYLGQKIKLKINSIIEVKDVLTNKDGLKNIIIRYNNDTYIINDNDYYFFKYKTESKNK